MIQFWASMSPILASRPICRHRKLPSTGYRRVIFTNYTNFIQDNENGKGVLAKAEGNFLRQSRKFTISLFFLWFFCKFLYFCALLKLAVCNENHVPRHHYLSHSLFLLAQQAETILKGEAQRTIRCVLPIVTKSSLNFALLKNNVKIKRQKNIDRTPPSETTIRRMGASLLSPLVHITDSFRGLSKTLCVHKNTYKKIQKWLNFYSTILSEKETMSNKK